MSERWYLCIDLKSFYASVECVERGLDPMTTNLVVADPERTEKTICLAVSPSMKALGVKNRCRVFEIPKNIDYIMATPQMQKYIDYSAKIYGVYLRYIAKEDIHVYSVDECFLDVTTYLKGYKKTAKEMAVLLMDEVTKEVGVRATCGVGTNLYLTKIALDITAKHAPDFIGILTEETYQKTLWDHRPLTDFWRIGHGTAERLALYGIHTMRELTQTDENLLYRVFGIDAELLIDHAWGREPVTIADIKAFKPKTSGMSSGQVLPRDYSFEEARIIVQEMTDLMCLELVDRGMVVGSMTLGVVYSNKLDGDSVHATASFSRPTSADSIIIPELVRVYEEVVDQEKPVRRICISCNNMVPEESCEANQLSLFDTQSVDEENMDKSKRVQTAVLNIKKHYGKDAILKGMNYREAATTRERLHQIGGHKSGK